jgi:hypothetical protein
VVSTVVMPVAKQVAPIAGGLLVGILLGALIGRRRQVPIVIAPAAIPPTVPAAPARF